MTVTWWPTAKRDQIVLASNQHLTLRPYEELTGILAIARAGKKERPS
jgi:hypothetical protein